MESILNNKSKLFFIFGIFIILIIFFIKFLENKNNYYKDNKIQKEIIEFHKKNLEDKLKYNKGIDSIYKKLDSINISIKNQDSKIIYQKSITNKYYENEKDISNLDASSFTYDSLINILSGSKFEPYQRTINGVGKDNQSK